MPPSPSQAETVSTQTKPGNGGRRPPEAGGGGGRDPGGGPPDYERRLRKARLGMILGVIWASMAFATLTTLYFARRSTSNLDTEGTAYVRIWAPITLPGRLLLWNTLILLASSLTLELARRQVTLERALAPVHAIVGGAGAPRIRTPWLALTALLGFGFLCGQLLAWAEVNARGFRASTPGPSPFFYVLTGAHAVHLVIGILFLLYAAAISLLRRSIERKRVVVEVTRWYWHFMGALWVYVFALLWFAR